MAAKNNTQRTITNKTSKARTRKDASGKAVPADTPRPGGRSRSPQRSDLDDDQT
jgi:hypothetical protein